MSDINGMVARNVRRFRRERGLSMSALAQRAGLAKQTLSTLEQGLGNPTVETLGLLSTALDVSLRSLLTEWGSPVFLQRGRDGDWSESHGWQHRTLDEVYGSGYVRTTVLRTDRPGPEGAIPGHRLGTLHHLYVIAGRVRTGPVSEPVQLGAGDFAHYPADVPHLLASLTERAVVHVVTTEPRTRQIRD